MRARKTTVAAAAAVVAGGLVAAASAGSGAVAASAPTGPATWTSVPAAVKQVGLTVPNVLSPQLAEHAVAQGSARTEGGDADTPFYGYNGNGPLIPAPGDLPAAGRLVEASKTEPDKNTYLRLWGQHGADAAYDYGTHFLYQGHETGVKGYLTRVNLDADAAHKVTVLATKDVDGRSLPTWDGSTWNPFAKKLLLTAELGSNGGVWQATADYPSTVQDVSWVFGRGGYEGIQTDSAGNVVVVEDVGGTTVPGTGARNPNSFVYRLVPVDRNDLTKGGRLQVLQVVSNRTGDPIRFTPVDAVNSPTGGAFTADQGDLHVYGNTFATNWVTIHDTATDTSGAAFDANKLAKAAGGTPFKRPENGVFRPGTKFGEFWFAETGDTNANSTANADFGGWTSVFKVTLSPTSDKGSLSLFYKGDSEHAGFDNVAFVDATHIAFVEDAGDGLHTQRAALDSAYLFDVKKDYSDGSQPVRFIAEGRDPSATLDSQFLGRAGFQNDGDNEITGIHVSNGDPTAAGLLGAAIPKPFEDGWRVFWTQQHGDNTTWEITAADD